MSSVRIAAPNQQKIVPAFTVFKQDQMVERTIIGKDAKGKRTERIVEEPFGFLVRFAKGHSVRARDEQALRDMGCGETVPLVNMDDPDADEAVGEIPLTVHSTKG